MTGNPTSDLQEAIDLIGKAVTIVKKVQVEVAREQERAKHRKEKAEA